MLLLRLACMRPLPVQLCSLINFDWKYLIQVVKKIHNPACMQDFSANIQRNATFHVDLRRCMDAIFLNNGSRVFSGHVEVGFHPLVVTSNDRLFSVKCIDNAYAISHRASKHQEGFCSHTIRLASRWESSTVFHVGDSVVHEWNCEFPVEEGVKYQTFLTNCNAISDSGQIIHLVDENGCIVDSELIGEIVYNNFMPKIFARARVFKFMNDEKHRIECQVQMCSSEGVCKDRIFPPKCAFTKEEILNRYSSNTKIDVIDDTFMTGTINNRYEHQIKTTSEWITVHNNQYTNIELLQERFYLSAVIDDKMEEPKVRTTPRHFLMGISYRSPNSTDFRRNELNGNDFSSIDIVGSPTGFQPQNPTIGSGEIDNIELSRTTSPSPDPTVSETEDFVTFPSTILGSDSTQSTVLEEITQTQTLMTTSIEKVESQSTDSSIPSSTTTQTSMGPTTKTTSASRKKTASTTRATMATKSSSKTTMLPITPGTTYTRSSQKLSRTRDKPATMAFYTNKSSKMRLSTTTTGPQNPPYIFASEISVLENRIAQLNPGMDKSAEWSTETDQIMPPINENDINTIARDKFSNPRDWRLDDRTINDTDMLPERQVACSNATIIASQRKCTWSGVEHLLVVWSFASLLVWIVMIGVCFYRQTNKPTWAELRERELQRMAQSRVLQHEHPWVHADAFEEKRNKNKNELTMIQGTF
nr:CBN-CUTL-6 protein [Haemonchus contortus]